jgi:1,4-dihydroxy-2-naphthoate octaprenyltransferase
MNLSQYISSIKVKNLLMSVSGILLGSMLAFADFHVSLTAVLFLILSVLCFQIIPNVIPGVLCALASVYFSYGTLFLLDSFIMMLLGYLVYRTVKRHGTENGLFRNGPVITLTSLLIYGIIPVFGAYYVCTHSFGSYLLFLPSFAAGALCLAVRNAGYLTETKDRIFHTVWIAAGVAAMTVYSCLRIYDLWHFLYLASLPLFVWLLSVMWKNRGEVKTYEIKLAATVLLFCVLSGLGFMIYLF